MSDVRKEAEALAPTSPFPTGAVPVYGVEDNRPLYVVEGRCVIGKVGEIPVGGRRIFEVGGRGGVGVFNVGGTYYAIRNRCPHRGGPLCRGRQRPHVVAPDVNRYAFEREYEVLKCPWHQWEFDLKTGWSLYDPKMRVQTYSVVIEDDQVVLVLDRE
jgi:3-phenylpropionate/trans-cinnamate dioxygenase ferredoxin subunit